MFPEIAIHRRVVLGPLLRKAFESEVTFMYFIAFLQRNYIPTRFIPFKRGFQYMSVRQKFLGILNQSEEIRNPFVRWISDCVMYHNEAQKVMYDSVATISNEMHGEG